MGQIFHYKIKVRYCEVDAMKRVHNSVYQVYFEEARVDLVRKHGYPYEEIEKDGYLMPISELNIKFTEPIAYEEEVTVQVTLQYIKNYSMKFLYKIVKNDNSIACEGFTIHAVICKEKIDFIEIPDKVRDILSIYLVK